MSRRPTALSCTVVACVAALLLAGCSSSEKEKEPSGATVSGLNRFMDKGFDRKKGRFDENIQSRYDHTSYSADKKLKDQQFRTDSFAGRHDYKGSSEYKAGEFSRAGQTSRAGAESFSGSGKTSRDGGRNYDAQDSRYSGQKARQGDNAFAAGDESYKTGEVRDAAKSQKKNTRPQILPKEDETGKSAYTEADVKRMVNRN